MVVPCFMSPVILMQEHYQLYNSKQRPGEIAVSVINGVPEPSPRFTYLSQCNSLNSNRLPKPLAALSVAFYSPLKCLKKQEVLRVLKSYWWVLQDSSRTTKKNYQEKDNCRFPTVLTSRWYGPLNKCLFYFQLIDECRCYDINLPHSNHTVMRQRGLKPCTNDITREYGESNNCLSNNCLSLIECRTRLTSIVTSYAVDPCATQLSHDYDDSTLKCEECQHPCQ